MSFKPFDLIRRLETAPQRTRAIPGRGDEELIDQYRLIVSGAERDKLIELLKLSGVVAGTIDPRSLK